MLIKHLNYRELSSFGLVNPWNLSPDRQVCTRSRSLANDMLVRWKITSSRRALLSCKVCLSSDVQSDTLARGSPHPVLPGHLVYLCVLYLP